VVKRDGVWQAFDPDGDLRYAAEYHRMVMAFVMTQPKPAPAYYDALQLMKAMGAYEVGAGEVADQISRWQEVLREAWEKRKRLGKDKDENDGKEGEQR